MPFPCHAMPLRVYNVSFPFDYTVRPCLIHTCHAHAMLRPCLSSQGHSTVVSRRPCCSLEKNGMFGAWHGHGMASVNYTRPHCVNQMGKTHSKPLAARHGRGKAWARHGNGVAMCESAFSSRTRNCWRLPEHWVLRNLTN